MYVNESKIDEKLLISIYADETIVCLLYMHKHIKHTINGKSWAAINIVHHSNDGDIENI